MSKFYIKVTGADLLKNALDSKKEKIIAALKKGVNLGAAVVEKEAKETVPVVTGNLMRSIHTEFSSDKLEALIGPDFRQAPYAYYVEFGRSRSGKVPPYPFAGRHYMEKSFYKTKEKVEDMIEGLIKVAVE